MNLSKFTPSAGPRASSTHVPEQCPNGMNRANRRQGNIGTADFA